MKARLLLLLFIIVACDRDNDPAGINYLNEVVDIMEKNSLHRYTINWKKTRENVFTAAGDAETEEEINRGLRAAIVALDDHHSFIVRNGTTIANFSSCYSTFSGEVEVPDNVGYIRVPMLAGEDVTFAPNIQKEIKEQDKEGLVGWIVDLRGNTGGNMWPMLAGVGPILGTDVAGYFIDPDQVTDSFQYKDGKSVYNDDAVTTVANPYTLVNASPKVAVLVDNGTASSGEAIAVAFVGRPETKFFGTPTCGLSTANGGFTLSDNAQLYLTIAVFADRNKNRKGGPIEPDVNVQGEQQVVDNAVAWLNEN